MTIRYGVCIRVCYRRPGLERTTGSGCIVGAGWCDRASVQSSRQSTTSRRLDSTSLRRHEHRTWRDKLPYTNNNQKPTVHGLSDSASVKIKCSAPSYGTPKKLLFFIKRTSKRSSDEIVFLSELHNNPRWAH